MTLEARFRVQRGDFTLDASFGVPAHGVTAVFGPSGCGKTTLLRAMAGLDCAPDGYLNLSGEIWQGEATFVPTHRRALGYVFQEASLFAHLTVRGNLEYGLRRIAPNERRVAFDEAVALLGLQSFLHRDPTGLSGGERQRVAIARALLTSPRLLLMDEPLTGLDARSKSEILPFMERLHDTLKLPILYVSHSFEEVARLADHMVLMEAGRVLACGPLVELLTRLDLPLAHAAEAESIVEAEVESHDESFGLTRLRFAAGQFTVKGVGLPIGQSVRLRVLARDVSVTLKHQSDTSILNILAATIRELVDDGIGQMTLTLDLGGGVSILSHVTRKSVEALSLTPGKAVFAQVKSVALLGPEGRIGG